MLARLLDKFLDWAIPKPFPLLGDDILTDLDLDTDFTTSTQHPTDDETVWEHLEQWAAEQQAAEDITALVAAVLRAHNCDQADMYAELIAQVLTDHYDFQTTGDTDDNDE